jgi:hypothetical protein
MASDMGLENLLAAMRIDLQFVGDQGGGVGRSAYVCCGGSHLHPDWQGQTFKVVARDSDMPDLLE